MTRHLYDNYKTINIVIKQLLDIYMIIQNIFINIGKHIFILNILFITYLFSGVELQQHTSMTTPDLLTCD